MYTITGREATGCRRPLLQNRLLKAVNRSGAVSPATRAMARIVPVMMPFMAAGTTTVATMRHLLAPSASAPSRKLSGTARRNCSVLRTVIGMTITLSATAPASAEKCRMGTTTTVKTNTPTMMEGTPFSRSVA